MMGQLLAQFLGTALGNLIGNPATWVAGLVLSRHRSFSGRFLMEAIAAILSCLAIQLAIERLEPGLPTYGSLGFWVAVETLSIVFSTIIFYFGRKLRTRRYAKQEAEYAQDKDIAED